MGSACHQMGLYDFLPKLQELLREYGLEERVEVTGAFCLGPCRHGIVLRVGDVDILELNLKNLEERFEKDILPLLKEED